MQGQGQGGGSKASGTGAARSLAAELQSRLAAEVQEREAEAALYSARLFESERATSDWRVGGDW